VNLPIFIATQQILTLSKYTFRRITMNPFLKSLTALLGLTLGMNALATVNYPTALKANQLQYRPDGRADRYVYR
jgi:hypothetical protein